jgi:hypothetical protein
MDPAALAQATNVANTHFGAHGKMAVRSGVMPQVAVPANKPECQAGVDFPNISQLIWEGPSETSSLRTAWRTRNRPIAADQPTLAKRPTVYRAASERSINQ